MGVSTTLHPPINKLSFAPSASVASTDSDLSPRSSVPKQSTDQLDAPHLSPRQGPAGQVVFDDEPKDQVKDCQGRHTAGIG